MLLPPHQALPIMVRVIPLSTRAKAALLPALATAFATAAAMASCITAPPADLPPQAPAEGPIIVQDAVTPPADQDLTALPPGGFVVPVKVLNPTSTIQCKVFVDFDTGVDNFESATAPAYQCPNNTFPALDGGLTILSFSLTAANFVQPGSDFGDLTVCHTITFFVADAFATNSAHTPAPDSLGADSVTWQYAPNGPGGCLQFDGGDGSFPPPADAPTDVLLLPPGDAVSP
jgi:hypothetical protein